MRKLTLHPSGSNMDAFAICGASHLLPQASSTGHKVTAIGNENHDLIAGALNGRVGGVEALKKALPHFDLRAFLAPTEGSARGEAAFVIDVRKRTSVYLGKEIGRDYAGKLGRPLEPYESGVSLDVDTVLKDGTPWVRDFKFGNYSTVWQVRVQAMAIGWSTGAPKVDVGLCYLSADDGGANPIEDAQRFYVYELDEHADTLVAAWDRVLRLAEVVGADSSLPTVEGPHCTYCGAYPHCPSKWKLAKSMLGEIDLDAIDALTTEQCGIVWAKWKEIEKLGKYRIEDALKVRMRAEGGLPLPNGKVVRMADMPGRRTMDVDRTRELLIEKGATVEEITALTRVGESYQQPREYKR